MSDTPPQPRLPRWRWLAPRAALLAFAAVAIAAGLLALAPAPASADGQSGSHGGWHGNMIRVGSSVWCNTGAIQSTIPTVGNWKRGANANSFDAHVRRGGCSSSWGGTGVGANEINNWLLELKSASGRSGARLTGATFGVLPSSFRDRNASDSTSNPRNGSRGAGRNGTDGEWSGQENTWVTPAIGITFTVPDSHTGDVYLLFEAQGENNNSDTMHSHMMLKFTAPPALISAFPLAVPQTSSGTLPASGTDLSAAQSRPPGGTRQRARLFLRGAAHSDTYTAGDANAARSAFDTATVKLSANADGTGTITGATITNSSGGVLSACDESTAGDTCTLQGSTFP